LAILGPDHYHGETLVKDVAYYSPTHFWVNITSNLPDICPSGVGPIVAANNRTVYVACSLVQLRTGVNVSNGIATYDPESGNGHSHIILL
jgi:hypothetical protein